MTQQGHLLGITMKTKSHLLSSHLEKGSETRCSFNGSLPVQAKLATAWFEATGTMKPSREMEKPRGDSNRYQHRVAGR
jgi:hypothetical protein